jgi:hypothetical protein
MTTPDWENFRGDITRVCLGCGYRWPTQEQVSVTDMPACPECGTATEAVLEETTALDWNKNEFLVSARLEIEISAFRKEGGVSIGWLKDEIDKLLKVLIAADCDTHSRLSGAPASEYMVIPPDATGAAGDTDGTGPDILDLGNPAPGSLAEEVKKFLDQIRGTRASSARKAINLWDADQHKN